MIKKEFKKGDFRVVWRPEKCIYSGICVKALPEVYDPDTRPWIRPENASVEALKSQIDQCPSGALSYYTVGEGPDHKVERDAEYRLIDNAEVKRYEFKIEDRVAFIDYIKTRNKVYLTHTEVPSELGGKGVGSALIQAVLQDIKEQDLTVVPLCPFVAAYIKKHPKWKELVAIGIKIK